MSKERKAADWKYDGEWNYFLIHDKENTEARDKAFDMLLERGTISQNKDYPRLIFKEAWMAAAEWFAFRTGLIDENGEPTDKSIVDEMTK